MVGAITGGLTAFQQDAAQRSTQEERSRGAVPDQDQSIAHLRVVDIVRKLVGENGEAAAEELAIARIGGAFNDAGEWRELMNQGGARSRGSAYPGRSRAS